MPALKVNARGAAWVGALVLAVNACSPAAKPEAGAAHPTGSRLSILLVTLDTTRADSIGPEAKGIETKAFNALASRGRLFTRAYATVPETLPSHTSMMTGLYPAGHDIHENARTLGADHAVLAERLQGVGYRTAAFVSSFVLSRRFGLGRGFETYDDVTDTERSATQTTDRAIEYLLGDSTKPLFLWVHYFDAHAPYAPPEPFSSRFAKNPYLGEIAAVDEQLGRLIAAFERSAPGPEAILVVGDHGEGLGDHGESQHGILLYESTMRVPMVLVGPGVLPATSDLPVSTRRVFHTLLDLAGLDAADSLRAMRGREIVLGEAMKPFLEYGWQPQIMAVDNAHKAIAAGRTEVYDVVADPFETRDLAGDNLLSRPLRNALLDYPVPSPGLARASAALGEEDRKKLASLGYVSAGAAPVVRKDAPRPVDMSGLFEVIEKASGFFVRQEYARAIPPLEQILRADSRNLDATLRLATAHSALGHEAAAERMFERAKDISPQSADVRAYLALHRARGKRWEEAGPMLDRVLADFPDRLPALESLARIRERQARIPEAIVLYQRIYALRAPTGPELVALGRRAMDVENTSLAIQSFEAARTLQGKDFRNDLELGVLYLAARRFQEARVALDRVPADHPEYPMALFKRAQVSVLLREPDAASRISMARRKADATTRELIARERLFLQGVSR
ncbi:MAG: sulfatase-like hydrolase/transferase [Vicinamibacteria bacterium]|nr:sulfatase-like hydrolase/transferase [Vicinamibacteria bacterium]